MQRSTPTHRNGCSFREYFKQGHVLRSNKKMLNCSFEFWFFFRCSNLSQGGRMEFGILHTFVLELLKRIIWWDLIRLWSNRWLLIIWCVQFNIWYYLFISFYCWLNGKSSAKIITYPLFVHSVLPFFSFSFFLPSVNCLSFFHGASTIFSSAWLFFCVGLFSHIISAVRKSMDKIYTHIDEYCEHCYCCWLAQCTFIMPIIYRWFISYNHHNQPHALRMIRGELCMITTQ